MKRITLSTLLVSLVISSGYSQLENGKAILKVYANFYKGLTKNDPGTAFEVRRVYLGYKGDINQYFSTEVKLDIGSPEDLSQYSLIRRYAYFKTAELKYQKNRLTLHAGLFDMLQFDLQETAWGYRYLYKSFMDEQKFGPSADIGVGVEYSFNDHIQGDLVISNGEGYKNLQSDNSYRTAAGLTVQPLNHVTFRIYYDLIHKDQIQSVLAAFLNYTEEKYRLSFEYNRNWKTDFTSGHDLTGTSVYGTYIINDTWEVFARYDRLVSNIDQESEIPWHITDDGSALIGGIQYAAHKNVLISLNYRDWYSYAKNGPDQAYIFVNAEFKL